VSSTGSIPYAYIPDHDARAVGRLLRQYQGKDRIEALVKSIAVGIQAIEDDAFDVALGTQFETSTGDALDKWGELVGEVRGGLRDDEYRRFIAARLLANRTIGTRDELIAIWSLATAPSTVRYFDHGRATFSLYAVREVFMRAEVRRRVRRLMDSVKPAGVSMQIIESIEGYFGFLEDDDSRGYNQGPFSRVV
jgi:hypothetical protein